MSSVNNFDRVTLLRKANPTGRINSRKQQSALVSFDVTPTHSIDTLFSFSRDRQWQGIDCLVEPYSFTCHHSLATGTNEELYWTRLVWCERISGTSFFVTAIDEFPDDLFTQSQRRSVSHCSCGNPQRSISNRVRSSSIFLPVPTSSSPLLWWSMITSLLLWTNSAT